MIRLLYHNVVLLCNHFFYKKIEIYLFHQLYYYLHITHYIYTYTLNNKLYNLTHIKWQQLN